MLPPHWLDRHFDQDDAEAVTGSIANSAEFQGLIEEALQAKREAAEARRKEPRLIGASPSQIARRAFLGFRLDRRNDGSEQLVLPTHTRPIKVIRVEPAKADPLYHLSMADYDDILKVIEGMTKVFERSPSVFATMNEEDLRTILLVALNGVFQGGATGETFNGAGKTDIIIRVKDVNVFIAECLIWHGPTHFQKKLTDQLFHYATWHDSKLAAIVFNRQQNFSAVVEKIRETVAAMPDCLESAPYGSPTACRHKFRRSDDPQKEFLLTCLAFEVPT